VYRRVASPHADRLAPGEAHCRCSEHASTTKHENMECLSLAASDLRFAPSPALGKEVRPVPDRPRHKTGFYSMLGRAGQTLERREATDRSATFPKWNLMLCAHAAHGVETERRLAWGVGCRTARQAQDLFMFNSSSLRSEFISICRKRWQAQASGSEETGRLGCGRRTRLCPKPSPFVPKWCAARTLTSGESTEASVRGRKQRLPGRISATKTNWSTRHGQSMH
jgi:hypothetical protein